MFIDIHVHNKYYEDDVIILNNIFPEEIVFENISDKIFYSIGLHPWHIKEDAIEKNLAIVDELMNYSNFIAIGETGLDKNIKVPVDLQKVVFLKHLEISKIHNKPVIIHCVGLYNDLINIRDKFGYNIPWIIHWFNGSLELANNLLRRNCYLSFGISLFKENSKAFKAFKEISLDRVFFETDDTGILIKDVYKKAANVRNIALELLLSIIKNNFKKCFNKEL